MWKASVRLSLNEIMRVVDARYTVRARVEQAFHLNCQALCRFLASPHLEPRGATAAAAAAAAANAGGGGGGGGGSGGGSGGASNADASPPSSSSPGAVQLRSEGGHQALAVLQAHRSILHQCAAERRLGVLGMLDACAAAAGEWWGRSDDATHTHRMCACVCLCVSVRVYVCVCALPDACGHASGALVGVGLLIEMEMVMEWWIGGLCTTTTWCTCWTD